MNILYYLENYPKLSESWIRNEIIGLQKRGHRVAVFSLNSPDDVSDSPDVIHYSPKPTAKDILAQIDLRNIANREYLENPLSSIDLRRHLFTHVYASIASNFVNQLPFDIDHIHGHFAGPPQVAAQHLARELNVSHSVTTHATDLYGFDHEPTRQFLYRHCDRLLTISEYNAGVMKEEADCEAEISVVPACFNCGSFTPTPEFVENRIVTIARHVEKKGISYALRSIAHIDEEVEYHVVSDGPLTSYLKELTERLEISDQVSFLGRVSKEQLKEELDQAELFLLPCVVAQNGDRDGIPVSLKEAMAMKTTPVTTYVSGIPELVDESCGYVVPPRNVHALSDALSVALSNNNKSRARKAEKRVQKHDKSVVAEILEEQFSNDS